MNGRFPLQMLTDAFHEAVVNVWIRTPQPRRRRGWPALRAIEQPLVIYKVAVTRSPQLVRHVGRVSFAAQLLCDPGCKFLSLACVWYRLIVGRHLAEDDLFEHILPANNVLVVREVRL